MLDWNFGPTGIVVPRNIIPGKKFAIWKDMMDLIFSFENTGVDFRFGDCARLDSRLAALKRGTGE